LGPVSLDGLGLGEALLCGLVGHRLRDHYVPRAEGGPDRLVPRGALVRYREWYGAASSNVGLKMTAEAVGAGIVQRESRDPNLRYAAALRVARFGNANEHADWETAHHVFDLAAKLVARHLTLGHSPQALIATLAHALLREDAGFHAYQMLEAGVRQFTVWGDADEGRHILVAVARYLAAHSPTERAALQTADIARRLMRGGELHHEAATS
jgi:hypothetical protein